LKRVAGSNAAFVDTTSRHPLPGVPFAVLLHG
jgi:hypothetical protein